MRYLGAVAATAITLVFGAACSSGQSTNEANPCATPGATYLFHADELSGGTCGPIPDQIINIGADGTTPNTITCDTITQNGCTAKDTGCSSSSNGVTCKTTTDVTFASDGSGATGLETTTCTEGSASCTSTYQIIATRE